VTLLNQTHLQDCKIFCEYMLGYVPINVYGGYELDCSPFLCKGLIAIPFRFLQTELG